MHEMTGNAVDYYIYTLENGHAPATDPHFLCIPKGANSHFSSSAD